MKSKTWIAAGAVAFALTGGVSGASSAQSCKALPKDKIGLQLYSVTGMVGQGKTTPEALGGAFKTLSGIGFKNVERFGGTLGLPDAEYRALLDANGMRSVSSHENLVDATWDESLKRAKMFGQKFVGSGGYGQPGFATLEKTLATAANLNRLGKLAKAQGLKLYVHNHDKELSTKHDYDLDKDGRTEKVSAWEIVAANTDPSLVYFEVDIHWARVGMGLETFDQDLLPFLKKYRKRIVLLHIKDTTADGKITDLGQGTTRWAEVYKAAGPQIAYYLWEYDRAPDPARNAEIAYKYMTCQ